jgi:hypothetical protein
VPWCADCDRYLSPSTVTADGHCPTCGRPVEVGERAASRSGAATSGGGVSPSVSPAGEEEDVPFPWHLKLLAVAIAIYLLYRLWQGIEWVIR